MQNIYIRNISADNIQAVIDELNNVKATNDQRIVSWTAGLPEDVQQKFSLNYAEMAARLDDHVRDLATQVRTTPEVIECSQLNARHSTFVSVYNEDANGISKYIDICQYNNNLARISNEQFFREYAALNTVPAAVVVRNGISSTQSVIPDINATVSLNSVNSEADTPSQKNNALSTIACGCIHLQAFFAYSLLISAFVKLQKATITLRLNFYELGRCLWQTIRPIIPAKWLYRRCLMKL